MAIKQMLTEEMPASALVARVLEEAGIEMVFGISGGHTGRIVSGLSKYQNSIRTVLVREESLGGVMAEIYGRLTRRPGVLLGQGPWVLGNGLLGTIEAHLSSSPMLLLTDFSDAPRFTLHAPYQQATGDWGSWDARRAFSGVTKHVMQAHDPIGAVQATQLAIKHALAGQPGPVAVLYAHDSLAGSVGPDSQPALYPTRHYLPPAPPPADPAQVEAAAKAILSAQKPVVIAGNGVRIAQGYDAAAPAGRGRRAAGGDHRGREGVLCRDPPAGARRVRHLRHRSRQCVCRRSRPRGGGRLEIVAERHGVGKPGIARPGAPDLCPDRDRAAQRVVELPGRARADRRCRGGPGPADRGGRVVGDAGADRRPSRRVAAHRERHGYFNDRAYFADDVPILPQRAIGELARNLPEDAIVTCDAGENRIMMTHFYQTKAAEGFLQAAGSGPMGFAIPAALGAKLVHPDRPVVAVCGDGGFAMTMNGLMTAVEQDIPIITVVFNNNALGWVLHGSGPFAAEFNDWDHAAIARALGLPRCAGRGPIGTEAGIAGGARRAPADGDRRPDLAQDHLRRHHLATGEGRLAAPEITKKGGKATTIKARPEAAPCAASSACYRYCSTFLRLRSESGR